MNKNGKNILIIILSIIVVGLVGFIILILTGVVKLNLNNGSLNYDNKEKEESIKLDKSKDYVYDADYKYDNIYTEYVRESEKDSVEKTEITNNSVIPVEYTIGKQYLKNLKVPYININSTYAKNVNEELKNLYIDNAKMFDACAGDISSDGSDTVNGNGCNQVLTYRVYKYNDIVSIVVINNISSTSVTPYVYKTYNFDMKTGELLDFIKLTEKLSYDYDLTLNKIKDSIKTKMEELYSKYVDLSIGCRDLNVQSINPIPSSCYDIAYQLLDESINNNSMYFVDNKGVINILAIPYSEAGQNTMSSYYLFKIEK